MGFPRLCGIVRQAALFAPFRAEQYSFLERANPLALCRQRALLLHVPLDQLSGGPRLHQTGSLQNPSSACLLSGIYGKGLPLEGGFLSEGIRGITNGYSTFCIGGKCDSPSVSNLCRGLPRRFSVLPAGNEKRVAGDRQAQRSGCQRESIWQ